MAPRLLTLIFMIDKQLKNSADAHRLTLVSDTSPRLSRRQKLFLDLHHHCVLCDSSLNLKHHIDVDAQSVLETAECPKCKLQARQVLHTRN